MMKAFSWALLGANAMGCFINVVDHHFILAAFNGFGAVVLLASIIYAARS